MTRLVSLAYLFLALTSAGIGAAAQPKAAAQTQTQPMQPATAIFAGGCFWCLEADFEKLPGAGSGRSAMDLLPKIASAAAATLFAVTLSYAEPPPGDYTFKLKHDGRERSYISSSAHTATRMTYGPCKEGVEVVLWKLTGAGHVWPGASTDYLSKVLGSQAKVLGPATDVIDANTQMWQFFAVYHTMTSSLE